MNARQFLDQFGRAESETVATKAGTSFAYFYQIANGHRRPSVELAERLVTASSSRLGFSDLLKSKTETQPI